MTKRSRSIGLVITLFVVLSMALAGIANAATAGKAARSHSAKTTKAKTNASKAPNCKTRNKATGTIKFSDWQFPDTLNPDQTTLAVTQEVTNGMFDGLFLINSKAKLQADMATTVPTLKNGGIKNGGKTFIINLKHGLHFANGTEVTSQDVKFSWQIGMDKASGPACTGSCDIISRIDTPSKYQVVFHLKSPTAPFLSYDLPPGPWPTKWAGSWNNNAHDAATVLYQDTKFNFEGPDFPTSGPYQVTPGGFVNNDRITLQPMKYYTALNCGGYLKNLIFAFYSDKPGMIAAAASKQTDVTQDYTAADLSALNQHKGSYKVYSTPGFIFEHLEFNQDSTYKGAPNPLANANVRLALALALNKYSVVQSALGVSAKVAKSVTSWSPLVNTPTLKQPYADTKLVGQWDPITKKFTTATGTGKALADAKALLSRTQWKGGFKVDLMTTSGNPVRQAQAGVIAKDWAQIGVQVTPNYIPASTLFAGWDKSGTLDHGDFQVAMFAFLGQPDPDQLKYNLMSRYIDRKQSVHTPTNENYSGITDKVFDAQFPAGARTLKSSARARAYAVIQVELNKAAYWVGLYFRPSIATANSRVQNFSNNPTQFGPTWNLYAWKATS